MVLQYIKMQNPPIDVRISYSKSWRLNALSPSNQLLIIVCEEWVGESAIKCLFVVDINQRNHCVSYAFSHPQKYTKHRQLVLNPIPCSSTFFRHVSINYRQTTTFTCQLIHNVRTLNEH